uniref:NADH-ubiquinone oxidoreductase chain 2 n=1 Tax=Ophiacantha linea TaxID=1357420 RepID=V9NJN7_9ECHI|nr:NADH dehydrogenase subunit 2 [Ophiacantha linea]AGQ49788.1 NADH dehydrogenase subunit 2 [Ophiacantha linea]
MLIIVICNINLVISIVIIFCSINWFIIWAFMELVTLSMVVLLSREGGPRPAESTSKYFLLQAIASVIVLSGIVLNLFLEDSLSIFGNYNVVAYNLLIIGLLLKMAIFPNPFWFVDVVSGINIMRSIYVLIVSKIIPLYFFFILSFGGLTYLVILVSLLSVVYGSILGVNQQSVRKIVALSSIAHLGWILLSFPLLPGVVCVFLFLGYVTMLFPFLWSLFMSGVNTIIKSSNGYYNDYNNKALVLSLLSLSGLPPFIGFVYKWVIFNTLLNNNFVLICLILILCSLISLFFYLQVCFSNNGSYWPEFKMIFLFNFRLSQLSLVLYLLVFFSFCVINLFVILSIVYLSPLSGWLWL